MAQSWYLRDDFLDNESAGSVNGTPANPGPGGNRIVKDTGSYISVSSRLIATGGDGTWGDNSLVYGAQTVVPGKMLIADITPGSPSAYGWLGFSSTLTPAGPTSGGYFLFYGTATIHVSGNNIVGVYEASTDYKAAVIQRSTGSVVMVQGGDYTNWTLLWLDSAVVTLTYPCLVTESLAFTSKFMRIPTTLWLPTPLASDGFGSAFGTTDGKGHAEGVAGGIGSGGAAVTWTTQSGTIGVSGGAAMASALSGDRAVATVPNSTINLLQFGNLTKGTTGCGIVLRFQDISNYIYAWHDGTYCYLIKRVGGSEVQVIKVAATYSAGATCIVVASGTSFRLFYNNAPVGTVSTISDAALQTTGASGIIFFDTNSTIGNFVDYAHGDENQYDVLNGIMGDQLFGEPQWPQLAPILAQ